MNFAKNVMRQKRSGIVLIVSMIFLLIFSALAVSLAAISANNVQISANHHQANAALANAHSGLEILRYYIAQITIPGTISTENRLEAVSTALQDHLDTAGITNISTSYNGSTMTLTMPAVKLNSTGNQYFTVNIIHVDPNLDPNLLQTDVTGNAYQLSKTIRTNFNFAEAGNSVFDYGVATKGPMQLTGNVELEGVNLAVEASVYIESNSDTEALSIIGNSQIAGDVSITNPDATVYLEGGQASIGGETGQDAIDNHVFTGVPSADFPEPIPSYFEKYVVSTIDMNSTTLENVIIPADTNPSFSSDITLKGIIYIETPNVINFTGNVDITGIIVGDGDWTDDSGTNVINITGNINSYPVTDLPDEEQFLDIKEETGTFIIAPGFDLLFGGNFDGTNGTIAGNGITFFGNAGGVISGTIINYSDSPIILTGNSDLSFNRSGTINSPAGFVPAQKLLFLPDSYSEI